MPRFLRIAAVSLLVLFGGFIILVVAIPFCKGFSEVLFASPPMTATVKIMPGAIEVINEDPFPWYGLTITLKDRYSTKYRFGDRNWGFLVEDSILEPNEDIGPVLNAFIDKDGNEYEGELYTILATRVTLEAKTRVDGSYDLKATFDFSVDDPIFDHGIWRTNKPATPDASAFDRLDTRFATYPTPYALSEAPERRPTIRIYPEKGIDSIWVEHHQSEYEQVVDFLADYSPGVLGGYTLPADAYREVQSILGTATPENERWQEQFDHWANIDAFQASIQNIMDDQIIDEEESKRVCFVLAQWMNQMNAARDYVQDYRRDDPGTVQKNPGLGNLEREAERALDTLSVVKCE